MIRSMSEMDGTSLHFQDFKSKRVAKMLKDDVFLQKGYRGFLKRGRKNSVGLGVLRSVNYRVKVSSLAFLEAFVVTQ